MSAIVSATPSPIPVSGLHVIPASAGCYYPPQIEARDILEVDFGVRELRSDELHLIYLLKFGWRGCRRFQAIGDAVISSAARILPISSPDSAFGS